MFLCHNVVLLTVKTDSLKPSKTKQKKTSNEKPFEKINIGAQHFKYCNR